MRLFISIELPEAVKNGIMDVAEELKKTLTPVKWLQKKNLHITLKFLGWVVDDKLDEAINKVKELIRGQKKFTVDIKGLGVFPEGNSPRIIWVGLDEGSGRVKGLGDILDQGLTSYREEEMEFSPHLTIGRIKERINTGALTKHLENLKDRVIGSFEVEHISIMKSTLKETGPIYEEIEKIQLN